MTADPLRPTGRDIQELEEARARRVQERAVTAKEPPLMRYSDPLAPLSPWPSEYWGTYTVRSWCEGCGEQTPTSRCLGCDQPVCDYCGRCDDCAADEDDED